MRKTLKFANTLIVISILMLIVYAIMWWKQIMIFRVYDFTQVANQQNEKLSQETRFKLLHIGRSMRYDYAFVDANIYYQSGSTKNPFLWDVVDDTYNFFFYFNTEHNTYYVSNSQRYQFWNYYIVFFPVFHWDDPSAMFFDYSLEKNSWKIKLSFSAFKCTTCTNIAPKENYLQFDF